MSVYDIHYRVNLTELAGNDLKDIARYISTQLNAPLTALKLVRDVENKISTLETMALAYPIVIDKRLAALGYRRLYIKNYIAFYRVDEQEKVVNVDRILYGRRDWQNIV